MNEMRKDRRAPASLKVKYKSATVDDFIEQFGADVSRGGIFIKTKKPLDTGALLKFEFQLQGGAPVIHGVGRVAWRRSEDKARADLPAGMGIKFIKLDDQSRAVIDRIEGRHGPGSRFDQTEAAEIAPPLSSLPPAINSIPPSPPPPRAGLQPNARRFAGGLAAADPTHDQPTFRPPPPATSSIPPALSDAWPQTLPTKPPSRSAAPKGALGSFLPDAAPRKSATSVRSTARDTSEFLASAFSVGGAGHEVRSQARVQVERARRDPQSVDLANELFGDLSEPRSMGDSLNPLSNEPPAPDIKALSSDPKPPSPAERSLSDRIPSMEDLVNEQSTPKQPARPGNGASGAPRGPSLRPGLAEPRGGSARPVPPAPAPAGVSVAPLSLALSSRPPGAAGVAQAPTGSARNVWGFVLGGVVLVAIALAGFLFMRKPARPPDAMAAIAPPPPPAAQAQPPAAATGAIDLNVTSEPKAAQVLLDGKPAGTTPATLSLTSTTPVELTVSSPGFASRSEKLSPEAGMGPKHVVLDPLPYELVISTAPPGATLRVKDVSAASPEPLKLGHIEDAVEVTVEKPGFQTSTRTVQPSEFTQDVGVMRATLAISLTALPSAARKRTMPASAAAPANTGAAPPAPPTGAPPEPASEEPAAPPPVMQVKPAAEPDEPAEAKPKAEAAPATPDPPAP